MNLTYCPLCDQPQAVDIPLFAQDDRREYRRCERCFLVWVPRSFHVSRAREKAEYDRHENRPDDPGYRRFLSRLSEPMMRQIPARACGLDFGCGPGPTLSVMLEEQGHRVALYDIFYHPDAAVLHDSYDFITASEVLEHLHRPGDELSRLWCLLRPGGVFGAMTKRVSCQQAFLRWHYKNDPTHVCFFSAATFTWWASAHDARVEFPGADTALLFKS
ncbi:MAG: class I SAM-dependent methyltransferase [Chromatocurvus sp.]